MAESPARLLTQLAHYYQQQADQCKALIEILRSQQRAVEEEQYRPIADSSQQVEEVFARMGRDRERISACQQSICRSLGLAEFDMGALAGKVSAKEMAVLQDSVEKVERHLKTAHALNEENNRQLQGYLSRARAQLKEMGTGRQTLKAYKGKRNTVPRFIDDKS